MSIQAKILVRMLSDRSEAYSVVIYEDDDMRVEVDTRGRVGAEALIAALATTGSDVEIGEHEIIDDFGLNNVESEPELHPLATEPLRVEICHTVQAAQRHGNKLVLFGRDSWSDGTETGKRYPWEIINKLIEHGLAEFTRYKPDGKGSNLPIEITLTNTGTQLR